MGLGGRGGGSSGGGPGGGRSADKHAITQTGISISANYVTLIETFAWAHILPLHKSHQTVVVAKPLCTSIVLWHNRTKKKKKKKKKICKAD